MQGLAIGVLVSGSMSILGRVYKSGIRKNRVLSAMAATARVSLGALQGGGLNAHLEWILESMRLSVPCSVSLLLQYPETATRGRCCRNRGPNIAPIRLYRWRLCYWGLRLLLFKLTQGPVTAWSSYTYVLIIPGLLLLVGLFFAEKAAIRPLIPNRLWRTP